VARDCLQLSESQGLQQAVAGLSERVDKVTRVRGGQPVGWQLREGAGEGEEKGCERGLETRVD
jgi:hypothetical protein